MSSGKSAEGLMSWLGLQWPLDYAQSKWLGGFLGFLLQAVILFLFVSAIGLTIVFGIAVYGSLASGTETTGEAIRNIGLVLAAIFGAPFIAWRSYVAHRQADIAEQSQITDRINKAVENLGATRSIKRQRRRQSGKLAYVPDEKGEPDLSQPIFEEITEPNLEVRIGAIYALERIAQDSLRDHVQIMEILTAYVRENAKAEEAETSPRARWEAIWDAPGMDELDDSARREKTEKMTGLTEDETTPGAVGSWARSLPPLRTDTQAALTVIGRRNARQKAREREDIRQNDHGYRLDLRETALQKADLSNLDISKALLSGARMEGADLTGARMEGAILWRARMEGADLGHARMEGAILVGVHIDADTTFAAAVCQSAVVKEVDFRSSWIYQEQVNTTFGDGSTLLPKRIDRPPHWPSDDLDAGAFDTEWRLWREDPNAYIPPQDRS